jgi:hypothetical protein
MSPGHHKWKIPASAGPVSGEQVSAAKQLFDQLEQRKAEVEAVIRSVPGLVSYSLVRTGDGGLSVTVCQDKAGTDASARVAREWIQKNVFIAGLSAPSVSEGSVLVQIK